MRSSALRSWVGPSWPGRTSNSTSLTRTNKMRSKHQQDCRWLLDCSLLLATEYGLRGEPEPSQLMGNSWVPMPWFSYVFVVCFSTWTWRNAKMVWLGVWKQDRSKPWLPTHSSSSDRSKSIWSKGDSKITPGWLVNPLHLLQQSKGLMNGGARFLRLGSLGDVQLKHFKAQTTLKLWPTATSQHPCLPLYQKYENKKWWSAGCDRPLRWRMITVLHRTTPYNNKTVLSLLVNWKYMAWILGL